MRVLTISTTDSTTTSSVVAVLKSASFPFARATIFVAGDLNSANGDRVDVQVRAPEASAWVDLNVDPFAVHTFVDSSGDFSNTGAVNLDPAAGTRIRAIYEGTNSSLTVSILGVASAT